MRVLHSRFAHINTISLIPLHLALTLDCGFVSFVPSSHSILKHNYDRTTPPLTSVLDNTVLYPLIFYNYYIKYSTKVIINIIANIDI